MTSAALQTASTFATWRPIPGFPDYEVGSRGYVRLIGCTTRGCSITVRGGVAIVRLRAPSGKRFALCLRRLVLEAFGPPKPTGYCSVNLGDLRDCSIGAIAWVKKPYKRIAPGVKRGGVSPRQPSDRVSASFSASEVAWLVSVLDATQRGADLRILARAKAAATVGGKVRRMRARGESK